jgi:dihydrofolate synthase/folylpolyglutamate synthase
MREEEAIEWIHSRLKFGSRPGLMRVEGLLEKLGHPERKIKTVHIGGTNGKGSTTSFLSNILQGHGLKVGTFTSPYIISFNERIQINSQFIPANDLVRLVEKIQTLVDQLDHAPGLEGITEFEILTALAFQYFYEQNVDIAVIEVGLGGALDSTNVIRPIASAITTIGLDHQEILGETLDEITRQKAGIIKRGVPVVVGNIQTGMLAQLKEFANQQDAPFYAFNQDFFGVEEDLSETFIYRDSETESDRYTKGLHGHHQTENASLAVFLSKLMLKHQQIPFQVEKTAKALRNTAWPGRMEVIQQKPLVLLDGAHNVPAVERLVENLKDDFKGRKIKILFAALVTKDIQSMLSLLSNVENSELILAKFDYPNAFKNEETVDWETAMPDLMESLGTEDVLIVTGSLYFVSQVRGRMLGYQE